MAQTRLHQFSTNSENINKTEAGGPVVYTRGVPSVRPGLCPHVPAQEPLPPLGTSPFSDTAALRMPGVLPHWLKTTILLQQQSYPSCCGT